MTSITKKSEISLTKFELFLFQMEELSLIKNQQSQIQPTNFFTQLKTIICLVFQAKHSSQKITTPKLIIFLLIKINFKQKF